MRSIIEKSEWVEKIYQLTTEALVLGFDLTDNSDGPSNIQASQLANRTRYLFDLLQLLQDAVYSEILIVNTKQEGLEKTGNGQFFRIAHNAESDIAFTFYQNVNGVAIESTSTPSLAFVQRLSELVNKYSSHVDSLVDINTASDDLFTLTDSAGFNLARLGKTYFKSELLSLLVTNDDGFSLQDKYGFHLLPNVTFKGYQGNDVIIVDPYGFWVFSAMKSKSNTPSNSVRENLILSLNAEALARSSAVNNTLLTGIQRPVFDYNIVLTYGQSLSTAMEAWPRLTKTAIEVNNVLMFGQSVRGTTRQGDSWSPVGGAAFNPLTAMVQTASDANATIIDDTAVASLPAGSSNEGESFDVGAVNLWRMLQNDFRGIPQNPARKLVVLNCGAAGRTVESYQKAHR